MCQLHLYTSPASFLQPRVINMEHIVHSLEFGDDELVSQYVNRSLIFCGRQSERIFIIKGIQCSFQGFKFCKPTVKSANFVTQKFCHEQYCIISCFVVVKVHFSSRFIQSSPRH